MVIQIETLHISCILIFASIYHISRVIIFENFKFINFSPKEKDSWIKGYLANASVKANGKTDRPWWKNWFIIDMLLIDSRNLAQLT